MIRLDAATAAPRGGARAIVGPIDLTVAPGERHLIVGANGSGKTTLMRLLAGLSSPAAGSISWDGARDRRPGASAESPADPAARTNAAADVRRDPPVLWPHVAALFETPDPQFLAETVRADIAFGLQSLGLSEAETHGRVERAADEYGLRSLIDRDPRTLSAGEKSRALLAAVLAARPRCLLLDQTLAHLDPGARRALEARLVGAERSGDLAVVRTHQDAEAPYDGERFHVLHGGRLLDAAALTPGDVGAASRVPLPLALRVSAALAARGAWRGALAGDPEALRRGLRGAASGADGSSAARRDSAPDASPRPVPPPPAPRAASAAPSEPAFTMQGVRWEPARGVRLFEGLDLAGERGTVVALVGRSGSGKTSLLRLLSGVDEPHAGRARRATAHGVRRTAALALEYPERQLIGRSVLEDVAMTLWVDGVARTEREERARRALAAAGIPAERFAARAPFTLSEGEKRRVAIAGLLADPAPLLLFDEPTAGLDPEGRRTLCDAFGALRREERTIVLASHDLDFVHAVADRVVLLARVEGEPARVACDGAPADVFRDAAAMGGAAIPPPDVVAIEDALREFGFLGAASVLGADDLMARLLAGPGGEFPVTGRAADVGAGAA